MEFHTEFTQEKIASEEYENWKARLIALKNNPDVIINMEGGKFTVSREFPLMALEESANRAASEISQLHKRINI